MLKMIIVDVIVLVLLAWGVMQFLHYKEREKDDNNGWWPNMDDGGRESA